MITKNVAVVGAGWAAQTLWMPLLKESGFHVNAVIDPLLSAIVSVKERYPEISCFDKLTKEALAGSDLLLVCSPNAFHVEHALFAMLQGLDVIIEKPVCFSSSEAEQIIAASKITSTRFWVSSASTERLDVARIRQLINEAQISDVRCIELSWRRSCGIPKLGSWFTNKESAIGGCGADLGWHLLDVGLGFLNYPTITSAQTTFGYPENSQTDLAAQWYGQEHQPSLKLKEEAVSVETQLYASLQTEYHQHIRLSTAWVSEQAIDTTNIKVYGVNGELSLQCTFGLSPHGLRRSYLTLCQSGKELRFPINEEPKLAPYRRFIKRVRSELNGDSGTIESEHRRLLSLSSAMEVIYRA
ncbi:Gfo/Idh/MocA-like oxidoreductase N-terminal domain-containing protein [Vibrio crassostreae]|nr:Gfo/Idh/MocA-like oxidoreductase N-terminal domain-containing protein [Vibrio crassostreae]CAK2773802.1 Gfo/Idh/MocA-like oxidoreductase N-terminal domain-containing protein [Vibrio crassostreae]CAK3218449.1 Gfo/Idh/MocA-like oxidoreductase N-terminal domain-containing protein [Vibrio crassostreae]CAK3841281.1 Gfo/Idh/MocA-like oxidoreductase N-terminal domain-containing protein [Vibrio crassostreae]